MKASLRALAVRGWLLWLLAWYLAALFGMTGAPAILAWRWFGEGPPWATALAALLAGTLPLMISAFAVSRGGVWTSRPVVRAWTFGWAILGGALGLSLLF